MQDIEPMPEVRKGIELIMKQFERKAYVKGCIYNTDVVMVLGFYVSPTAKVIRRRGLGLKSHPKDCYNTEPEEEDIL